MFNFTEEFKEIAKELEKKTRNPKNETPQTLYSDDIKPKKMNLIFGVKDCDTPSFRIECEIKELANDKVTAQLKVVRLDFFGDDAEVRGDREIKTRRDYFVANIYHHCSSMGV